MPANPPKGEEMNISSPVGGFAGLAGGDVGFWDIVKPMRKTVLQRQKDFPGVLRHGPTIGLICRQLCWQYLLFQTSLFQMK